MASEARKRVLVADDEEPRRRELRLLFEGLGCVVDEGRSFESVRELLRERTYDLIVCDNNMPYGEEERAWPDVGLELMADASLSEEHHATPFVLHTGDDQEKTKKGVELLKGHYRNKHDTTPAREFFEPLLKAKQTAP